MDQYSIELNRLYPFQEIETNLKTIDLSQYTTFPFDTHQYSSYILFHYSFLQTISLLSLGLIDEPDLTTTQNNFGLTGEFCCFKISEIISKFFNLKQGSGVVSNTPANINMDQLAEFSSELLVSNLSIMNNNKSKGNFYIIFPNSILGDQL